MIVGSGVDVVEVARIERVLARRGGAFERRVFSERERRAALGSRRPGRSLAERFAVKEAALKAVGTGWGAGARFRDVEVLDGPTRGCPRLLLHGVPAERAGGAVAHAAVSASRHRAVAVVLLEVAR